MGRIHLSLLYLGKKPEIHSCKGERLRSLLRILTPAAIYPVFPQRDGSCFLVAFISSRDGGVWAEPGFPLPKNYLNFQLHRRVGSRLLLQLFVLGFSTAGWEFIFKPCG
jgi:hypothetical protein